MKPRIVTIVEGVSDKGAVEILIRRWFHEQQIFTFDIRSFVANGVGNILARDDQRAQRGIEYWIRIAQNHQPRAILVLLDADEECEAPKHKPPAAKLGPWLLSRATAIAGHIPISVVIADRRFESWFLCPPCQQALHEQGVFQKIDLDAAERAKGRSSERLHLLLGRAYSNTVDQASLTAHMPLGEDMAAASRSFRKLRQELMRLCRAVTA